MLTDEPVGVVGGGVIGASVAYALAAVGRRSIVLDTTAERLDACERRLNEHRRSARLQGQSVAADTASLISLTTDLSRLQGADWVIENVPEEIEVKAEIYRDLDGITGDDTLVAANTSAIPIGELGAFMTRPENLVGVHFMNPVHLIDTVEVVRGRATSDLTLRRAGELLATLGKQYVVVQDSPGFVVNRILMLAVNEAARTVADGVASAAEVDRMFQSCLGHRMGLLRTADLIGLDTVVDTLEILDARLGHERYRPAPLLKSLVSGGKLGRKAGEGFFTYGRREPL